MSWRLMGYRIWFWVSAGRWADPCGRHHKLTCRSVRRSHRRGRGMDDMGGRHVPSGAGPQGGPRDLDARRDEEVVGGGACSPPLPELPRRRQADERKHCAQLTSVHARSVTSSPGRRIRGRSCWRECWPTCGRMNGRALRDFAGVPCRDLIRALLGRRAAPAWRPDGRRRCWWGRGWASGGGGVKRADLLGVIM